MIIKIRNLKLKTIIGVYDWEQSFQRSIIINIRLVVDDEKSTLTDQIEDTLDYGVLVHKVKNFVAENRFKLVEKMSAGIIDLIMQDSMIVECRVKVEKLNAIDDLDSFAVVLTRKR